MVKEVILNQTVIPVNYYTEEKEKGLHKITIDFKVTSEDYHDITTLLYEGVFDVKVPEKGLEFKGQIHQYSTSFTNLYIKGQIGDFKLSLVEVAQ